MAFPVFPPGTKSLLSRFLTPEVYEELKDRVTPGGFTLQVRCVTGVVQLARRVLAR
jgi:hypothetical protein